MPKMRILLPELIWVSLPLSLWALHCHTPCPWGHHYAVRAIAHSHCKAPGPGQGPVVGPGTMDFYITLCTIHTAQGGDKD